MGTVTTVTPPQTGSPPTIVRSRNGRALMVRPARLNDQARIVDLLLRLSPASRLMRYLAPRTLTLPEAQHEARRILAHAERAGAALLIAAADDPAEMPVALAELAIDHTDPTRAEFALVVRDDYQADGIGALLIQAVIARARRAGVATLIADFLPTNRPIHRLIKRQRLPYSLTFSPTEWRLELRIVEQWP